MVITEIYIKLANKTLYLGKKALTIGMTITQKKVSLWWLILIIFIVFILLILLK